VLHVVPSVDGLSAIGIWPCSAGRQAVVLTLAAGGGAEEDDALRRGDPHDATNDLGQHVSFAIPGRLRIHGGFPSGIAHASGRGMERGIAAQTIRSSISQR
jgi:hypothetical protein